MRSVRFACATISAPVLAATVIVAAALTPGYSHMVETVSRLGSPGQPYAMIERAGVALYGILVVAGAGILEGRVRCVGARSRLVVALVRAYGATAILSGVFPKDAPSGAHTPSSAIHVYATIVGGCAIVAAMLAVSRWAWSPVERRWSVIVGIAAAIAGLTFTAPVAVAFEGVLQRVALSLASLWIAAMALREHGRHSVPAVSAFVAGPRDS